ncbi:MAG: hypothetical protein [Olavius algarvensis Gamma 1 endosymbiont]|nr:MAG: hypothetical protein [Olavius algarvensis Gamma 1 endosymbiont]
MKPTCGFGVASGTPFHLILRPQRGEKRPDVRSLSDLRLNYCGIEETGRIVRSISFNRPNCRIPYDYVDFF